MKQSTTPQSGFIALISILLIAALVFVIAIGLSSRSLGIGDVSFGEESSYRALLLAESCAERTLALLVQDPLYAGEETLSVGDDTCHIRGVSSEEPSVYVFTTDAEVARYIKRISITAMVNASSTEVVTWGETPM